MNQIANLDDRQIGREQHGDRIGAEFDQRLTQLLGMPTDVAEQRDPAPLWWLLRCHPRSAHTAPAAPRTRSAGALEGRHTGRMQKMSLQALAREQQELAAAASSGRSARTVWGGHEHILRQTVIALTANSALSEHENPGEATVQVMTGRVRLDAGADHWDGRQGDLLFMPPGRHSLTAIEDAVVLLTVAKARLL